MNYIQCVLKKGPLIQMRWIPRAFAIKGLFVKMKERGEWQNGWKVIEVTDGVMEWEKVKERQKLYRRLIKISDIEKGSK